jgi:hypothetical protein
MASGIAASRGTRPGRLEFGDERQRHFDMERAVFAGIEP